MNKMKLLIILLSLLSIIDTLGQEMAENRNKFDKIEKSADDFDLKIYEFDVFSYAGELARISSEKAGTHFFGAEISRKLYLLDEYYTYNLPLSPGNPTTKKMVKKPLIYAAVRKIERQLKNDVSKKRLTIDAARIEYNKVLDVALCLVNHETGEFENAIRDSDNISEVYTLFTRQVLLNYIG